MHIDGLRIYFNAVLGGIGGVIGWALLALAGIIGLMPTDGYLYLRDALTGLLVGVSIGAAIGSTDGLIVSRSMRRLKEGAKFGAILGAIGGVGGLILGEIVYGWAGGGVWPRAIGWAVFGACVGTSDGFARKMPLKIRYGIVGGVLGGLIGGATYDRLSVILISALGDRSLALGWGAAVGLILLGACIGALVGLVESLLRKAWLTFLSGRMEGQNRTLDPSVPETTLGKSDLCGIVLLGDRSVANVHAGIRPSGGGFVLSAREAAVTVERNGQVQNGPEVALQPGDRIQLGSTRMVFQAEGASVP
jgi:hypothetical protein